MTAVEWLEQMVFNEEDLQDFVLVNVINQAKELEEKRMLEFAGIVSVAAVARGTGWSIRQLYNEYK